MGVEERLIRGGPAALASGARQWATCSLPTSALQGARSCFSTLQGLRRPPLTVPQRRSCTAFRPHSPTCPVLDALTERGAHLDHLPAASQLLFTDPLSTTSLDNHLPTSTLTPLYLVQQTRFSPDHVSANEADGDTAAALYRHPADVTIICKRTFTCAFPA